MKFWVSSVYSGLDISFPFFDMNLVDDPFLSAQSFSITANNTQPSQEITATESSAYIENANVNNVPSASDFSIAAEPFSPTSEGNLVAYILCTWPLCDKQFKNKRDYK